jgi:hypothetical protein
MIGELGVRGPVEVDEADDVGDGGVKGIVKVESGRRVVIV